MAHKLTIAGCETCPGRECSIFSELHPREIQVISETKGGNLYKRGQDIFYEGTRPAGLYCIRAGKVKVYKIDHTGKEQIVRLAKSGDILGYQALINDELYSAFAAPLEESVICFIPRERFFELLESHSALAMRVMQLLSHELQAAENRIIDMAQKPVRERLAESLLLLQAFYGVDAAGALDVRLTREDLANLVGTATETVIRFLSEFRHDKLISLSGRKISILDQPALRKTANVTT